MLKHQIYRDTLENGMHTVLIPYEQTQLIAIGIGIKVGSSDENINNNGIAHLLEHMMYNGTKTMTSYEIGKKLDEIGSNYNAHTSKEDTFFYITGSKDYLTTYIDIIIDLFLNPLLDEHDLEKEKRVVIDEVKMYDDKVAESTINFMFKILFKHNNLKYPIGGTIKNINNITRKNLIDFRKTFYIPSKSVFILSGNFDKNIISYIKSKFIELSPTGTSQEWAKPTLLVREGPLIPHFKKIDGNAIYFLKNGIRVERAGENYVSSLARTKGDLSLSTNILPNPQISLDVNYQQNFTTSVPPKKIYKSFPKIYIYKKKYHPHNLLLHLMLLIYILKIFIYIN